MKKPRTKIYVKVNLSSKEVIYTGIEFAEFIKYLSLPMENLLLLKGDCFGSRCEHNFEVFEGQNHVKKLATENIHSWGDFCFVDYVGKTGDLNEGQIAELLYMGHLFKPLKSPFFEPLQNRFAYLAHDDGWYCKLYCRDLYEFIAVLSKKIANDTAIPLPITLQNRLFQIAESGLLIDLEEKDGSSSKIYTVGSYSDMDEVLNNWEKIKANSATVNMLSYSNGEWTIS